MKTGRASRETLSSQRRNSFAAAVAIRENVARGRKQFYEFVTPCPPTIKRFARLCNEPHQSCTASVRIDRSHRRASHRARVFSANEGREGNREKWSQAARIRDAGRLFVVSHRPTMHSLAGIIKLKRSQTDCSRSYVFRGASRWHAVKAASEQWLFSKETERR